MNPTIHAKELEFISDSDNILPRLKDPSGRYTVSELEVMSSELSAAVQDSSGPERQTITFSKPVGGLPATWDIIDVRPASEKRGYFKKLVPLGALKQSAAIDHPSIESDQIMSGSMGYSSVRPNVESQPMHSGRIENAWIGSRPGKSERVTGVSAIRPGKGNSDLMGSEEPRWMHEFLKGVALLINDSEALVRDSDRVLQGETLEAVTQEAEKFPEQFALLLYQSLIRTFKQAAKVEQRDHDLPRLEMVLHGLERIQRHRFPVSPDRKTPKRTAGDSADLEKQESSLLRRMLTVLFS